MIRDLVGSAAAVCTTVSFLPQLIRVWRLKSARDISITMFLVFSVGLVLWLVYGVITNAWPIIMANAVTLALSMGILVLKMRYDRRSAVAVRTEAE